MHLLKKFFALTYMICKTIIPLRKVSGSNRILIVAGGHIGDIVLDASAWNALVQHSVSQGKDVYVLATREAWNMLYRFLITDQVEYVECSKNMGSIHALKDGFSKLNKLDFETIVARPHGNRWMYLLAAALPAEKRYIVLERELIRTSWSNALYLIFHRRYTGIIVEDEDSSEKNAIEALMHMLGYDDYHMQILPLPCQGEAPSIPCRPYITISVDSQNAARRWSEESFIALIGELLKRLEEDIVLTGSFLKDTIARQYEEAFRGNARVKIMCGRLSFEQWIELLRGARFHVGVDSGSIHMAAAVDTVAFCLAGYWHIRRFFPYQDDMIGVGTAMPIAIYRKDIDLQELNCSGCAFKGPYGKGNRTCMEQIRDGKPCLCLQEIQVYDVTTAISEALNSGVV